ncbi:hypothetical protein K8B33_00490 [Alcanivorax sp. JB21]|uniref:hypothetical protein n=1 Tax=Alcanivorax limicola TaxID=2874102 RepID=UPI001CBD1544|nr:hypothetical protein [Alcanivorax limicola]MBZ2187562.1 hypothetical protein [Alcanivorax limicola]
MKTATKWLVITLAIAASGCGGSGGGDGGDPNFSHLVVTDNDNGGLLLFDITDKQAINHDPVLTLALPTPHFDPTGLTYHRGIDALFVAGYMGIIHIYDDFSLATEESVPSRSISGPLTQLSEATDTALDASRGLLYVVEYPDILVFDRLASIDGDVAPAAVITGLGIAVDSRLATDPLRNLLYVADPGGCSLFRLANASAQDGAAVISAEITYAGCDYPWGISLDARRDMLYVSDQVTGAVFVFHRASQWESGARVPDRTIAGEATTLEGPSEVVVNPLTDRLYVLDADGEQLVVWDNASTVDGDVPPDWAISADNDVLSYSYDLEGIR